MAITAAAVPKDPIQGSSTTTTTTTKDEVAGAVSPPSESGGLHLPDITLWTRWALGSILLLAVPFYRRALQIEGVVEDVCETVAEDVEKAAAVVEKAATGIADSLPKDSIVENDFVMVANWADIVAEEAKMAESFIEKVDQMKEKVEEDVEPIITELEAMAMAGPGIVIQQ